MRERLEETAIVAGDEDRIDMVSARRRKGSR